MSVFQCHLADWCETIVQILPKESHHGLRGHPGFGGRWKILCSTLSHLNTGVDCFAVSLEIHFEILWTPVWIFCLNASYVCLGLRPLTQCSKQCSSSTKKRKRTTCLTSLETCCLRIKSSSLLARS